jgi:hypothetical protein
MTVDTSRRERSRGNAKTKTIVALLALSFLAGVVLNSRAQESTPGGWSLLLDVLSAPGCYVPLIGLTLIALTLAAIGSYYGKQKLDVTARIWNTRAAREEALTEKHWRQLGDLTPGPNGQELARIIQDADGRLLLLRPGVATAAVTILDPDAAVRPNQTSDQLALAAVLSDALGRAGGIPRSSNSLETLFLGATRGRSEIAGRVPSSVRVLSDPETLLLDDGREE